MTLRDVADANQLRLHPDGIIRIGQVELYEWGEGFFCVCLNKSFVQLQLTIRRLGGKIHQQDDVDIIFKIQEDVITSLVKEIRNFLNQNEQR